MWCPVCKNEYREGITVCADCKTPLVETLDETKEDYEILAGMEDENRAKKLVSYLEYSKIPAFLEPAGEDGITNVYVAKKMQKQAKKAFQAFYTVEMTEELLNLDRQSDSPETAAKTGNTAMSDHADTMMSDDTRTKGSNSGNTNHTIIADLVMDAEATDGQDDSETGNSGLSGGQDFTGYGTPDADGTENGANGQDAPDAALRELEKAADHAARGTYVSKAEKSSDYRSTGFTFTIFGAVGIVVMILHWAGVFHYFTTLSAVIATVMFIAILAVGIDSFRRSAKAKAESVEEERFVKELTAWLEQNLTIDHLSNTDQQGVPEELNFLGRLSAMKAVIKEQFGELDSAFLDQFAEDYYDSHFSSGRPDR